MVMELDRGKDQLPMTPWQFFLVFGVELFLAAALAQSNVPFSYSGADGPEKWGSLTPAYALCSNGRSQSPIDIQKKNIVYNPKLTLLRKYTARNATLVNTGHSIEISFGDGGGYADIDSKSYILKNVHWHTPSEHVINGQRYAAELHLVHISEDNKRTVVAVLYKYGKADPFLHQIEDSLEALTKKAMGGDTDAQIPIRLNTRKLSKESRKYFRYWGSLTTPPCSENVLWTILGNVREISKEQVNALKFQLEPSFKNNSRPLQRTNGRKVQFYTRAI